VNKPLDVLVKRIAIKGNENILTDYWTKNILEWHIEPEDILAFAREAINNLWIYAAFQEDICCGILVNEEGTCNAMWLIHVLPEFRNKGIGTFLYKSALQNIQGKWTAGIGTGYWWQGVPMGCGEDFLEKRGFKWSWTSIDMMLSLEQWTKPDINISSYVDILKPEDSKLLIHMLQAKEGLSGWVSFYKTMIDNSEHDRILVAHSDSTIVGCAMILEEKDIRCHRNIDGKVGGIGCIGVKVKYRERGIGTALVAEVHCRLKAAGYTHSYVGYTWLEGWYGKMGYEVFCRQLMGERY
jgi:ribosomal protein S18 acetylase RimI-like enzyme